jgi:Holliday junction resolvasome RuvABC endonuclease subunit
VTTIGGIDISLVSTGLARITTDGAQWSVDTWSHQSRPGDGTLAGRTRRIRAITDLVHDWITPCDVVIIEGPSLGGVRGAGAFFDRAWLWGAVVTRLTIRGVTVAELPPASRAKFATDRGGADKAAIAMAVARMWPAWTPGRPAGVNDQADALVLASAGVVLAGLTPPFPMPGYRTVALAKVPALVGYP